MLDSVLSLLLGPVVPAARARRGTSGTAAGNRPHRRPTGSVLRQSVTRPARQRGASIPGSRHNHAVS